MVTTADRLLSLATQQAVSDSLTYYNYVVGQSIEYEARLAQAEAYASIIADVDRRTYIQSLLPRLLESGVRSYSGLSGFDVYSRAAEQATGSVAELMTVVSGTYKKLIRSRRATFTNANIDVGREANRAAAQSFERQKLGSSKYRSDEGNIRWRRFADGAMKKALEGDEMFLARPDGLLWINAPFLDLNAPQWYRLNFGAGTRGASTPPARAFKVEVFGQNVGSVGLVGFRPSPPFRMPKGFFTSSAVGAATGIKPFGPRAGQAYRPLNYRTSELRQEVAGLRPAQQKDFASISGVGKKSAGQVTKGIRGTNYLDAGIATIARAWPLRQNAIVRDIMQESVNSGGTATEFSLKAIDLSDQRKYASQLESEVERLVNAARGSRGFGALSSGFLDAI